LRDDAVDAQAGAGVLVGDRRAGVEQRLAGAWAWDVIDIKRELNSP